MEARKLSIIAGISYLIIFFSAIFANFFVIESLVEAPLSTVQNSPMIVRFGILAFLITVVFDVVVAWAFYELFKGHFLNVLSTLFRVMHAAIMGVAIFSLPFILEAINESQIINQLEIFNAIWLIGLFFFGIHLILLGVILKKPKLISLFLILAGAMYILDTVAHFLLPNYTEYGSIFLALVAIPSIVGEMSLAVWLLMKGFTNKF
ncbi:DUF4386 domain-containing protein [Aegicerativicinus sediminis]|uniref:DUF4386 domain-containing protein n=1 Tax=Aegicerativicinus sediminis TaxID=2893202 RepID=UPI001E57F4F3|nr:DUF4386 domain-containing protein [Aegicerativicinus sediminis]